MHNILQLHRKFREIKTIMLICYLELFAIVCAHSNNIVHINWHDKQYYRIPTHVYFNSMFFFPRLGYIFLLVAWRAKLKVNTDQLWPTDPGLGISGLEVWHLSLNKAILQRLWDCLCLGNGSPLCLSGDTSVCQAFLLIRTRGYCELCSALILCHSLFMERHTPTRIYTKIISAQKQLFISGHEPPYL